MNDDGLLTFPKLENSLAESQEYNSLASLYVTAVGLVLAGTIAVFLPVDLIVSICAFFLSLVFLVVAGHFCERPATLRIAIIAAICSSGLLLVGVTLARLLKGVPVAELSLISQLFVAYSALCLIGVITYICCSIQLPRLPSIISLGKYRLEVSIRIKFVNPRIRL